MTPVFPVIMAGGPGSRLWPESRKNRPKPFLPLLQEGRSLIRATLDRIGNLAPDDRRFIVAGRDFEALVREQAPELDPDKILLEPEGRDTAPCVAWAAMEAQRIDPDAVLLVLPSDHLIEPDDAFRNAVRRAVKLVEKDNDALVALGVEPKFPATCYGYVERDEKPLDGERAFRARKFREKPDLKTAREFCDNGNFYWNAGIFVWKANRYLDLLRRFEPELGATLDVMRERIKLIRDQRKRPEDDRSFVDAFRNAKKISIDYAILERAENVLVLPVDNFSWNDIGSFNALEEFERERRQADTNGNLAVGASLVAVNAKDNCVRVLKNKNDAFSKKKLVAFVGVDDLLVVETDDAILVANKKDDQALKNLVKKIKLEGLDEFL